MPKVFSGEEKEELKIRMFEEGFALLKSEGMTHMSVEKITGSCSIGKSTFYNFFTSKEDFVIQLIDYKRSKALAVVRNHAGDSQKMTVSEGKELLKSMACSSNSIYQYLKLEDLLKLQKKVNYLSDPDIDEERELLKTLFSCMQGVREDPDYALIANLLKLITLMGEEKKMFHEEGYDRTVDSLYHTLFQHIFAEGAL